VSKEYQRGPLIDACNRASEDFTAGLSLTECTKALRKALKDAEELPEPPEPTD